MIDYLTSKPLALPMPVTSSMDAGAGEGTLTTNLKAGVVFLENEYGEAFRLSWKAGEADGARGRTLPEGEYKLRTYRVMREEAGQKWHVSATAPKIQMVTIKEGKTLNLELDPGITISSQTKGARAMMSITGQHGAGLSIYRDSARIPMAYRFTNPAGEQVAKGAMNYG